MAITFVAVTTTALAAPPTVTSATETQTFELISPCTGELITGTTTVERETRLVEDANGGFHFHVNAFFTGTYTGSAGTTFTDMVRSRLSVNVPASGGLIVTDLGTGHIMGSDGTKILDRGRFTLVIGPDGNVRVERLNVGPICQKD
ncbi:hypothetical protein [Deinococcus yavapaiensis]|uniref:hypothetical protein n=1 Tax=Deinococcus yavapaiensis TaxID=309889 RepID=UPI0011B3729A|nr:hypothetical protein [Deinococcus yavapaiensis]